MDDSGQASFWLYPLRRVSVPPELAFGPPRFLFKGVPPQPNCPSAVVPGYMASVRGEVANVWCSIVASYGPRDPYS